MRGVVLLSPTRMASFEFHMTDLVKYTGRPSDVSALDEMPGLAPAPVLCIYGTDDEQSLCPLLPEGLADVMPQDSGHRLPRPGARWSTA